MSRLIRCRSVRWFCFILAVALLVAPEPVRAEQAPVRPIALLVIDIQDFYFPGGAVPLSGPEVASSNAAQLLERSRKNGVPVIHVGHNARTGRDFHADVRPHDGEIIVMKDEVNAFLGTDLHSILQQKGIERLVLCGMQTHMCVEAAARAASDLGYEVSIVGDACATRDLTFGDTLVPASQVHTTTLATLDRTYGKVVSVVDALEILE